MMAFLSSFAMQIATGAALIALGIGLYFVVKRSGRAAERAKQSDALIDEYSDAKRIRDELEADQSKMAAVQKKYERKKPKP